MSQIIISKAGLSKIYIAVQLCMDFSVFARLFQRFFLVFYGASTPLSTPDGVVV